MRLSLQYYFLPARISLICLISALLLSVSVSGQNLTESNKNQVVEKIADLLRKNYVFPDKGKEMAAYIRAQSKKGSYKNITQSYMFSVAITVDLQKVHQDAHLALHFNPREVEFLRKYSGKDSQVEAQNEELQITKRQNFGFKKVEILPGNIGYIDLRFFYPPGEAAKKTVAAAMSFLSYTDAVILDLRYNGGGNPEMVQLVMSYFFGTNPLHYNSIYNRVDDSTRHFYTLSELDGQRLPDVDLFVLTSSETFSGAEEMAYNLQALKRATIVGETTRGGAHPVRPFVINDFLILSVPFARSINAVTGDNWEGKGVVPSVLIKDNRALLKAHSLALEQLIASSKNPQEKKLLQADLEKVKNQLTHE